MTAQETQIRRGEIDLGDQRLETFSAGPSTRSAPTLVMLHEGLGSAALWGDLPTRLAEATGYRVVAYSRAGLGFSSPKPLPWPASFMHDEALLVLPRVLDAIGLTRGLLVGASDGSSIATIHAGTINDERIAGLSLTAPHFIVEEATAAGARAARLAYDDGSLKAKLARWHKHVDIAFNGWNQAFCDPEFMRTWSIVEELGRIEVPVQILQGERDEYGTLEQIEIARRVCRCPLETKVFAGLGHSLHREGLDLQVTAIAEFAKRLLG